MSQLRINLVDIKDYFNMRANNQASNVKWENVKHLNTKSGFTLWQLFAKDDDYDTRYEPSKTQIDKVKLMLKLQ